MTTGRINQVAFIFRPQCIPRTNAERRGSASSKEARGSPEREAKLRHVEIATTNKGPRDNKRYLRTQEHADGIDAPTRAETPKRRTTARRKAPMPARYHPTHRRRGRNKGTKTGTTMNPCTAVGYQTQEPTHRPRPTLGAPGRAII